jgi:hypothetical protein
MFFRAGKDELKTEIECIFYTGETGAPKLSPSLLGSGKKNVGRRGKHHR